MTKENAKILALGYDNGAHARRVGDAYDGYNRRILMSKTYPRGLTVSLAILFLASGVFAQAPTAPKTDCEPDNCISKVLYLPEFPTASELQDVANMLRSILDVRYIEHISPPDHTITLKGSPEQFAAAGKILNALQSLRLFGGRDPSSILVFSSKVTWWEPPGRSKC